MLYIGTKKNFQISLNKDYDHQLGTTDNWIITEYKNDTNVFILWVFIWIKTDVIK